jgi:hypothetical protein
VKINPLKEIIVYVGSKGVTRFFKSFCRAAVNRKGEERIDEVKSKKDYIITYSGKLNLHHLLASEVYKKALLEDGSTMSVRINLGMIFQCLLPTSLVDINGCVACDFCLWLIGCQSPGKH